MTEQTKKTPEDKKIILFDETDKIPNKQSKYHHNKLLHNLIIGSELETQNNNATKRMKLIKKLQPNQEYGCYNNTGVHSIVSDGSLHSSHNVEIIYAGTNFSTEEMREQLNTIETAMLSQNEYNEDGTLRSGFYTDTRTGQHISFLQIKPYQMPELILRNIYQLCRIFSANIAYLTATGVGTTPLRSGSIEYARLPNITARGKTFKKLMSEMREDIGSEKYNYLNISKNVTNKKNNKIIDEMFFELRVPDRIMSPTIEASLFQLTKAIALKGATISKRGLILAKQEFWDGQKEVYQTLQQKNKETVKKHIKKDLEEQTLAFLKYLKPEFDRFAPEAYEVLEHLAKNPLWTREYKTENKNGWITIEKEFYKILKKHLQNNKEEEIINTIETDEECFNNHNKEELIKILSERTKNKPTTIENKLKKLGYEWNKKLKLFEKKQKW